MRYKNVDPMMGFLICERVATLWELEHIYDLEDAYIMHEAVYVPRANDNIAAERASKEDKARGM